MQKSKQLKLFKTFQAKAILALILLAVAISLFFIIKSKHNETPQDTGKDTLSAAPNQPVNEAPSKPADLKYLKANLDKDIDSILFSFGIKKEWITTQTPGQKITSSKTTAPGATTKTTTSKRNSKEAEWFVKDVLIPKDLPSAEVNLDISLYTVKSGLLPAVNEDIKTKDIVFDIKNAGDTTNTSPLARIYISHSNKVNRETGTICLVLSNLNDYKKDEIDKILSTTNEFSFIFPRNLENIELQNRLVQSKNDAVINITVSAKDNSDADFSAADDKDFKQKVKSFSTDFPAINKIILTKSDAQPLPQGFTSKIADEFSKYNIKVFKDSILTSLLNNPDEESKDKINIMINNIKSKAMLSGRVISIINLSYDDFTKLYNEILSLKKRGYKFYNLADYMNKEAEKLKKDKQKEEKDSKDKTDAKKEKIKPKTHPKEPKTKSNPKRLNDKKK